MSEYVCKKCGGVVSDGQDFCPACGTKKEQAKCCTSCGNPLDEGVEFCPKCGAKVGTVVNSELNTAIANFNASVENKKSKSNKKKYIAIGAVILVVGALFLFIFRDSIIPFTGTYKYVSSGSNTTYTFTKDNYTFKSNDDSYTSTYVKDGKTITLIDDDGDKDVYYLKGNYMYDSNTKFDESISVTSGTVDQTFTYEVSGEYEDVYITLKDTLKLTSDGKYTFKLDASSSYTSTNISTESGTYEIVNGEIIMTSSKNETRIFLIDNNYIYHTVLKK